MPKTEKQTIKLKVVFASEDGKDSDKDAARFRDQLDNLLRKFKAKSEFKWETTTERVGRAKI